MLQAGARICKSLGEEFLPYLGIVMPPLLASAQLKPDVRVTDAGSDAGDDATTRTTTCAPPCSSGLRVSNISTLFACTPSAVAALLGRPPCAIMCTSRVSTVLGPLSNSCSTHEVLGNSAHCKP